MIGLGRLAASRSVALSSSPMLIGPDCPLLLASGSPRRRELLRRVGVPIVVEAVHIDEMVREGELAGAYLERIVDAKLAAARGLESAHRCAAVLVADTAVVLGKHILGKPSDERVSREMIEQLAGQRHEVATRFAIATEAEVLCAETVATRVWFRSLDGAQIDRYVATGEGADKAGAYAIQGVGAMLVERIEGCYANVVGLPLSLVVARLQSHGLLGACPVQRSDLLAED